MAVCQGDDDSLALGLVWGISPCAPYSCTRLDLFVTAEQLLGRMLDPTDPEAALRQEVELHGVEGVLEEAKRWLREGEELDSSFEADVRLAVSVFERPSTQRD